MLIQHSDVMFSLLMLGCIRRWVYSKLSLSTLGSIQRSVFRCSVVRCLVVRCSVVWGSVIESVLQVSKKLDIASRWELWLARQNRQTSRNVPEQIEVAHTENCRHRQNRQDGNGSDICSKLKCWHRQKTGRNADINMQTESRESRQTGRNVQKAQADMQAETQTVQ
jgi:hypothetical protein